MSLHRGNGFYPGTGAATDVGVGSGEGFTVNVRPTHGFLCPQCACAHNAATSSTSCSWEADTGASLVRHAQLHFPREDRHNTTPGNARDGALNRDRHLRVMQ